MRENTLYKPSYGAWSGRPAGTKPDFDLCCVEVWGAERGALPRQCRKNRGFGPGEAYCKTHDPEAAAARDANGRAKYVEEHNERRYQLRGKTFFNALAEIAAGHNDPRALAQAVLDEFKSGELT